MTMKTPNDFAAEIRRRWAATQTQPRYPKSKDGSLRGVYLVLDKYEFLAAEHAADDRRMTLERFISGLIHRWVVTHGPDSDDDYYDDPEGQEDYI